jgi:hypothetical protein
MTVYFITEKFLKENGIISSNVDANDYTGLIQGAAKSFLRKQLGSYFFNDLLTKFNNQTLSADEITLVSKMKFAIAWRVKAEATVELTYQLKNKGVQTQSGDDSESVELNEVLFLVDRATQKAIQWEAEIKEYMIANKNLYPEFLSTNNNDSSIKNYCNDSSNNYNEGVGFLLI